MLHQQCKPQLQQVRHGCSWPVDHAHSALPILAAASSASLLVTCVVQMLINDLTDLYRQAGTGTFSTLLEVEYDPETHEPTAVELATPIYHHQSFSR